MSPWKQVGQGRAGQAHLQRPPRDGTAANGNVWRQQRGARQGGEREVKVAVPMRTGKNGGSGGREVEVEGRRGTWPRAACEAEAGNVQRAESVHVRDCRAAREGQLGREGQGTESCGMPDAAAASAGWSHGHTVCAWPGVESASGRWGHGGIRNWMAGICLTPDFREDQDGLW